MSAHDAEVFRQAWNIAEGRRLTAEATIRRVRALLALYDSWDGTRPHPGESSPRQREDLRRALDPQAETEDAT